MKRPKTDRCQKPLAGGGRCDGLPGQCIHNFQPTKFGTREDSRKLDTLRPQAA